MTRRKPTTTLFARILSHLILPLLLLSLTFSAIQLWNQMNAMNKFYQVESRYTFDSLQRILTQELADEANSKNLSELKPKLDKLAGVYHVSGIRMFSGRDLQPLFSESIRDWDDADLRAVQISIEEKSPSKPYRVRVDKKNQRLLAYLPLEGNENQIFAARVVYPLASIKEIIRQSRRTLAFIVFFILLVGVRIGQALAESIIKPIRALNEATQDILNGNLGREVHIYTGDEIQTLGETFNRMSTALKEMKQRAQDANPLTQLPGNQEIFHELSKRILERQKFVLFHTDLDRFKIFNDGYGLARGDEAIRKTAELLKKAVRDKGEPDDFVGHQGGDDFIIITRPNHAKEVAEYIIKNFDSEIVKSLYRKEDYERGYTLEVDRRRLAETGEEALTQFPLVAISLAGVSTAKNDFADYFDCMNTAVAVKKEVKKKIESAYVIKE